MSTITNECTQFFEQLSEALKSGESVVEKNELKFPKDVVLLLSDDDKDLKESIKTRMGFNNHVMQAKGINNVLIANYKLKNENEVTFTAIPKTLLISITALGKELMDVIDENEDLLIENYLDIDSDDILNVQEELGSIIFATEQLSYQNVAPTLDLLCTLGEWHEAISSLEETADLAEDCHLNTLLAQLMFKLEQFESF